MIDWLFTLHDQPWFRLIELMIGLGILLYGITRERDEPEDKSRIGEAEIHDRPQHAQGPNVVPIDGWRESNIVVKSQRLS